MGLEKGFGWEREKKKLDLLEEDLCWRRNLLLLPVLHFLYVM